MTSRITGTGSCLAGTCVTNDWLSGIMDTSDEWIRTRTGIRERHLVKEETTTDMAYEAAVRALKQASVAAEDLELIVVGTVTADHVTPSAACELQARLGADRAMAFDINAACSGFLFAIQTADAFLQAGRFKNALVIGAESLSRIMDWSDRSTCVLFGDGAGAAVMQPSETGILGYDQGCDGKKGSALLCVNRKNHNPLTEEEQIVDYVHMDGQEVYRFAVTTVPASIQKALEDADVEVEDVKYFVLHQANLRIIQSVAKRLHVSEEKFPIGLDHCGNMSAASVPVLLDEINRKGMLQKGDKIVLSGFGGGLSWGSIVMEW